MASCRRINPLYRVLFHHSRMQRVLAILPCARGGLRHLDLNDVLNSFIRFNCSFFPSVACLSHWFRRKRALAMGIVYSGSSIGGVIWPILMSHLLNNPSVGFKWSLRIAGFINVFLLGSESDF